MLNVLQSRTFLQVNFTQINDLEVTLLDKQHFCISCTKNGTNIEKILPTFEALLFFYRNFLLFVVKYNYDLLKFHIIQGNLYEILMRGKKHLALRRLASAISRDYVT